jgi:hypothetical protein
MLGVPYLLQSEVRATCDACESLFDPGTGGYCRRCNRLLCARHFHGTRWQRLWRTVRGATDCRDCERKPTPR